MAHIQIYFKNCHMWYNKVNTPGRFVLWLTVTSDKEDGDILVASQKRYTSKNKQTNKKNLTKITVL